MSEPLSEIFATPAKRVCAFSDCRCKDDLKVDWRQPMLCKHWFCKAKVTPARRLNACPVPGCGQPARPIQSQGGRPTKRKAEEETSASASASASSASSSSSTSPASTYKDDASVWKCPLCWEPSDGTIPVMFCKDATSCGHSIHKKCELEMKKFNIRSCPDCAQEWTHTLPNRTLAEMVNRPAPAPAATTFFPDTFTPANLLLQHNFKTGIQSFFSNRVGNTTAIFTQVYTDLEKQTILPMALELETKGWDVSWQFNRIRVGYPVSDDEVEFIGCK